MGIFRSESPHMLYVTTEKKTAEEKKTKMRPLGKSIQAHFPQFSTLLFIGYNGDTNHQADDYYGTP